MEMGVAKQNLTLYRSVCIHLNCIEESSEQCVVNSSVAAHNCVVHICHESHDFVPCEELLVGCLIASDRSVYRYHVAPNFSICENFLD